MKTASTVLLAVAAELSKLAKDSMPRMREGEKIRREWYKDGIYRRESVLDGRIFIAEYDFRQRKCRFQAGEDAISDNRNS